MSTSQSPIKSVCVEGLVVAKIIKHSQEDLGQTVQGVLVGLMKGDRLEVTNCFKFPTSSDPLNYQDTTSYQLNMMKQLRHVNVDYLHVGFYQTTIHSSFMSKILLESQFRYQSSFEEDVVLIYDPTRKNSNGLSLHAYRLSDSAMKSFVNNTITHKVMMDNKLSYDTLFVEIPLTIHNSTLVRCLLYELESRPEYKTRENDFLSLGTDVVLEKSLRSLIDNIDVLNKESSDLVNYNRSVAKITTQKQHAANKRQSENKERESRGEPALPEEDIQYKFPPAPPRLDSVVVASQMNQYVDKVNDYVSQNCGKLLVANELLK